MATKKYRIGVDITKEMEGAFNDLANETGATKANLYRKFLAQGLAKHGYDVHYNVAWGGNRYQEPESDSSPPLAD